jgi:hypothetical protein
MFAGHLGAALAMSSVERRTNVGIFVLAALLLDIALWIFVLLGWESLTIPADFATRHQVRFDFPYTHSLLAAIGWSVLACLAGIAFTRGRGRPASLMPAVLAAAVFSHWVLDALVHEPELPLAGENSTKVGLGLWDRMPIALGVESAIVIAGILIFIRGSRLPRSRSAGLAALVAATLVSTIAGMTLAPPPPSATAMAAGSLGVLVAVCALACWLGKAHRSGSPVSGEPW